MTTDFLLLFGMRSSHWFYLYINVPSGTAVQFLVQSLRAGAKFRQIRLNGGCINMPQAYPPDFWNQNNYFPPASLIGRDPKGLFPKKCLAAIPIIGQFLCVSFYLRPNPFASPSGRCQASASPFRCSLKVVVWTPSIRLGRGVQLTP